MQGWHFERSLSCVARDEGDDRRNLLGRPKRPSAIPIEEFSSPKRPLIHFIIINLLTASVKGYYLIPINIAAAVIVLAFERGLKP